MKKKILFINGHLNAGGCERSLVDVLKNFDYSKYSIDLLLLEELGDYIEEVPKEVNIILYSLKNTYGSSLTCIRNCVIQRDWFSLLFRIVHTLALKNDISIYRFSRILFRKLEKQYDTVVAYRQGICTYLAAYAIKADKKISWWHHGELDCNISDLKRYKQAYKRILKIVAVSSSSSKVIKDNFKDFSDKVVIVPNMIDDRSLADKAIEKDINNDKLFTIVSVGRMSPEKNMKVCPEVAKLLKDASVRFQWYLIGDGPEAEEIKEIIKLHNVESEITMLGRLTNPYPYIQNADLLVHPSMIESQGLTILEAMTLGTPVVVAKSSGPLEFIDDGRNGLITGHDAKSIFEKINYLLKDRDIYNELKRNTKCSPYFNPKNVIENIEEII